MADNEVALAVFVTDVLGQRRAVDLRFRKASEITLRSLKQQCQCASAQTLYLSPVVTKTKTKNKDDDVAQKVMAAANSGEEILLKCDADIELIKPRSELRIAASRRATQMINKQTSLNKAQSSSSINTVVGIVGSEKADKVSKNKAVGLPGEEDASVVAASGKTSSKRGSAVQQKRDSSQGKSSNRNSSNSIGGDENVLAKRPASSRRLTGSSVHASLATSPPFRVTSFAPVNSGGTVFTAFIVEYRDPRKSVKDGDEIPTVMLLKRYSQFQELHKDIGAEFGKHVLPKLPSKGKKFSKKTKPDSIVRRMRKLEGYLNEIAITIPKVLRSPPFRAFVDAEDVAPSDTGMKSDHRRKRRESFYRHDTLVRSKSKRGSSSRDDPEKRAAAEKRLSVEAKKADVDRADTEQAIERSARVSKIREAAEEHKRASIQLQTRAAALAREEAQLKVVKQKRRESQLLAEQSTKGGNSHANAFSSSEALQAALAEEARKEEERERVAAEAKAAEERERVAAEAKAAEERERVAAEAKAAEERERVAAEAKAAEERERVAAEVKAAKEAAQPAQPTGKAGATAPTPTTTTTTKTQAGDESVVTTVRSLPKAPLGKAPVPKQRTAPLHRPKAVPKKTAPAAPAAPASVAPVAPAPVARPKGSALDDLLSDLSMDDDSNASPLSTSDAPPASTSLTPSSASVAESKQAMDDILAMLEAPDPDDSADLRAAEVAMDDIMSLLDGPEELVEVQQKQVEAERQRLAEERERIRQEAQLLEQIILDEQEEDQIMSEMIAMRQQAIADERQRFENYRSEAWVLDVMDAERRWRAERERKRPSRLKARFANPVHGPGGEETELRVIQFVGVADYGSAPGDADDEEFREESSRPSCVMCGQSATPLTPCNGGCGRAVHEFCRSDEDANGTLPRAWMCFDCADSFGGDEEDDPNACVMCGATKDGGVGELVGCASGSCTRHVHLNCMGLQKENDVLPVWFCFDCEE